MPVNSTKSAADEFSLLASNKSAPGIRSNLLSALTNRGQLQFMVFKNRFTVAVFLKFLARLLRQNRGRRLFLIIDNHPVHVAKAAGSASRW